MPGDTAGMDVQVQRMSRCSCRRALKTIRFPRKALETRITFTESFEEALHDDKLEDDKLDDDDEGKP